MQTFEATLFTVVLFSIACTIPPWGNFDILLTAFITLAAIVFDPVFCVIYGAEIFSAGLA